MLLLENEYYVYLTTNIEEDRQVVLTLIRLSQGTRDWMFKRGRRHPNIYRDQESVCSREAEDIQTHIGTKRVYVQERQKTSKHI